MARAFNSVAFGLLRAVRSIVDTIGLGLYVILVTVVFVGGLVVGLVTMFETKPGGAMNVDSAAAKATLAGLMAFAVIGVVGGICLPYVELHYRQRGEDVKRAVKGQHWVRWTYSQEEWANFLRAEGEEAAKEAMVDVWIGIALTVFLGGMALYWQQYGQAAVVLAVMLLYGCIRVWSVLGNRNNAAGRRMPEVFVARDFVLSNGKHTRINWLDEFGSGRQLSEIKILETTPPIIELTAGAVRGRVVAAIADSRFGIATAATAAAAPNAGAGPPLIVRVPVPAGKLDEAKALVARFEREVIGAGA